MWCIMAKGRINKKGISRFLKCLFAVMMDGCLYANVYFAVHYFYRVGFYLVFFAT
jgi:hypothetical protein